ncbi:hypothetical protein PY310_08030 [Pseudarthrobacter sp. H3Y2-7]|jgi:hypothetical protein|uniref:hypothetical protein n=1 Tax=Pseudarthrobacter TaxID=1742993 RepID=UPI0023AEF811|nr:MULTISPECIES: hypothetical protein [unclassified Pseudarthrobacter]MDE8668528.1 hypothetical protein [Pseudarthrobacter sp. H3Y2-7]
MIRTVDDGLSYLVRVPNAAVVDDYLNSAVNMARQFASTTGLCGILVTRHAHDTYTVAVSEAVPFGETHERLDF